MDHRVVVIEVGVGDEDVHVVTCEVIRSNVAVREIQLAVGRRGWIRLLLVVEDQQAMSYRDRPPIGAKVANFQVPRIAGFGFTPA